MSAPRAVAALSLMLALSSCGASTSSKQAHGSLAAGCRATPGSQTTTTATYAELLHVGPQENMAMPAEVKAEHLTKGEEMLGGSMAELTPTGAGISVTRHLEVHICFRASGKVVVGQSPSITLASAGGAARQVPVMEMQGITAGAADYHYGNNVPLHPGETYAVTVALKGNVARFSYTEP
jgi:hypothetical protein